MGVLRRLSFGPTAVASERQGGRHLGKLGRGVAFIHLASFGLFRECIVSLTGLLETPTLASAPRSVLGPRVRNSFLPLVTW